MITQKNKLYAIPPRKSKDKLLKIGDRMEQELLINAKKKLLDTIKIIDTIYRKITEEEKLRIGGTAHNKQSTEKGACGCGNAKYNVNHLPQDHAGWQPD